MPPNGTSSPRAIKSPTGVLVIVTGDRHAQPQRWGSVVMDALVQEHTVVCPIFLLHGDCSGIDRMAGGLCTQIGFTPIPLPAQWTAYGNAAGPRRNSALVQLGRIYQEHGYYVVVLAFHDSLATSKGTGDMVRKSRAAGFPVRVFTSEGEVE